MQIGWLAAHCVLFDKLRVLIRLYCSFGWGGGIPVRLVRPLACSGSSLTTGFSSLLCEAYDSGEILGCSDWLGLVDDLRTINLLHFSVFSCQKGNAVLWCI